jgi:glycosyltransferase involved in cell wall biosynthesis
MRPPRVLFVTTSYPSDESPAAGAFVLEHARAAADHVEIAVLHLHRAHGTHRVSVSREADAEFPTWRVRYPYRPTALSLPAHIVAGVAGYLAVRRDGFDPDLLHAHFFLSAVPAMLFGKPLVETEQWSIFLPEDPMRLSGLLRLGSRLVFRRARLVLPVSSALERGILEVAPHARTRVVRNVVDTSLFHSDGAPHPGRLLSVGLFYHAKGHDLLIDALREVVRSRPDVELHLIGDGALRPELERQAEGLPVTFHGFLPKREVADIMRTAQLLVLPSRFETSSAAGIEALASGVPVVGMPVAAVPELIGPEDGVLAGPPGLAHAILEALDRGFDRDAIESRARARYGREAIGLELARVYRTVLEA